VADFPDHIQDLKEKFIVTRQGHTKLFLPAYLVKRYNSNSGVETEAMKAVHERKLLAEEKQKYEREKKINRDQQKIADDTLKELRKAGIYSSELASMKGKENIEELQQQRKLKEEATHKKINKDTLNAGNVVSSAQSSNNLNVLNAVDNLPGSSKPNDYPVESVTDSCLSHANQNVPQMWIPNSDHKKPPDSHSDMSCAFKSSQENISGGSANLKYLPEGDTNAKVIVSRPCHQLINESHNKPQLMPTQHVTVPKDNPHNLEVGSLVQFGSPPCYGVIKWIGSLPEVDHTMGGVEVVCL